MSSTTAPDRLDVEDPMASYAPEPHRAWHDLDVRAAFADAVADRDARREPVGVPLLLGGHHVGDRDQRDSVDPGEPARVVARAAEATREDVGRAVDVAAAAHEAWAGTPAVERARVLLDAAAWLRARRDDAAAEQVLEAGKPWAEADGDVCEAIDFLEYYARQALVLSRGGPVQSPPGETNRLRYRPRGVTAVIAPWNFPLAIPTGMTVGALAAGNATILKPAEQTPGCAWPLVAALEAAGLPDGVLGYLPGAGEVVGAALVEHPDVATVAFTGSREVGFGIVRAAAEVREGQDQLKQVVCELGGKNAVVVAADADLDEVVPAVAASAFGFAGQKCSAASRLVVVEEVHDQLLERLAAHTAQLRVGHPRDGEVDVGPVIDADAHARLLDVVADPPGRVVHLHDDLPTDGWFVPPAIVAGVDPGSPFATQEHFGPVLAVLAARDLDHAVELANATPYALTAGLFTRSARAIEDVSSRLRAGNVYVNRGITGAIVGRHPFGGYGHSGLGTKAGGPDYLKHFCVPVAVSERTVRAGFTPDLLA